MKLDQLAKQFTQNYESHQWQAHEDTRVNLLLHTVANLIDKLM